GSIGEAAPLANDRKRFAALSTGHDRWEADPGCCRPMGRQQTTANGGGRPQPVRRTPSLALIRSVTFPLGFGTMYRCRLEQGPAPAQLGAGWVWLLPRQAMPEEKRDASDIPAPGASFASPAHPHSRSFPAGPVQSATSTDVPREGRRAHEVLEP